MSDLRLADISEFQPGIDWAAYGAASPAVIVRAHNGVRKDKLWGVNGPGAAEHCRWWAAYQYLPASMEPSAAAQAFRVAIGDLRPNAMILDLEEGDGDQSGRQHAWLAALADDDVTDWTYSGDYFARAHGLAVDWVAAYQSREPTTAHVLWQNTDRAWFAGIQSPCDGSIFHGTVDDLIALTGHPTVQEDDMSADSTAILMIVTDLQKKVDDLEANKLTPIEVESLFGKDNGLYAKFNAQQDLLHAIADKLGVPR